MVLSVVDLHCVVGRGSSLTVSRLTALFFLSYGEVVGRSIAHN